MLGELAAVVPRERMHASAHGIERVQDRSHRGIGGAAFDPAQSHQAGVAFDEGDDADRSFAHNRVAFPITDTLTCVDDGRPLCDVSPTEALTLARRAAAVASPWLATAQMLPQPSSALTVGGDVLVDAFVTDRDLAFSRDFLRTPAFGHTRFDGGPDRRINAWLRARRMPALHALPLRIARLVAFVVDVADQLATDRAASAIDLPGDREDRKSTLAKVLNRVAFVLAQVRVAHVQFHLAVKLCRLPRLRLFTSSGDALQS